MEAVYHVEVTLGANANTHPLDSARLGLHVFCLAPRQLSVADDHGPGFGNTFTTTSSCPSRNSLASARTLSAVRLAVSCWLSFK